MFRAVVFVVLTTAMLLGTAQAQAPSVSITPSGNQSLAEDTNGGAFRFSVRIENMPSLSGAHSVTLQLDTTGSKHTNWSNPKNWEKTISGGTANHSTAVGIHNDHYELRDDHSDITNTGGGITRTTHLTTGRRILTRNYRQPSYRLQWPIFDSNGTRQINYEFRYRGTVNPGDVAHIRARVLDIRRRDDSAPDNADPNHASVLRSFTNVASNVLVITARNPDIRLAAGGPADLPNFVDSYSWFTVKADYFNRNKRATIALRFGGQASESLTLNSAGRITTRDLIITPSSRALYENGYNLGNKRVRYDIEAHHFDNNFNDDETLTFTVRVRPSARTGANALTVAINSCAALNTSGNRDLGTATCTGGPISYSITNAGNPTATISPTGSHLILPGETSQFSVALDNIPAPFSGSVLFQLRALGNPNVNNFMRVGDGVQSTWWRLTDNIGANNLVGGDNGRTTSGNSVFYTMPAGAFVATGGDRTIRFTIAPRGGTPATDAGRVTLVPVLVRSRNNSGTPINEIRPDQVNPGDTQTDRVAYRLHPRPSLAIAIAEGGNVVAVEPRTAARNADHGAFSITVNDITPFLQGASRVGFFFRGRPGSTGSNHNLNPGYGTLTGIGAAQVAILGTDYDILYVRPDGTLHGDDPGESLDDIPAAGNNVYIFRVIPRHDIVLEPTEHAAFGVRMLFRGLPERDNQNNNIRDDANIRGAANTHGNTVRIRNAEPTARLAAAAGSTELIPGGPARRFTLTLEGLPIPKAGGGGSAIDRAEITFAIGGSAGRNLMPQGTRLSADDFSVVNQQSHSFLGVSGDSQARLRMRSFTFSRLGVTVATFNVAADSSASPGDNITISVSSVRLFSGSTEEDVVMSDNISGGTITYNIVERIITVAAGDDSDATEPGDGADASDTGFFTITLSDRVPAGTRVRYELSGNATPPGPDGTALANSDYILSAPTGVTFSENSGERFITFTANNSPVNLTVRPVADTEPLEPDEKVILRLFALDDDDVTEITNTPQAQRTVNIAEAAEDELPRIITATATDLLAIEPADGTAACNEGVFTIELSPGVPAGTEAFYELTGAATKPGADGALASGSDYSLSVGAGDATLYTANATDAGIRFTGATNTTRVVTLIVTPVADSLRFEGDEQVTFQINPLDAFNSCVIDADTSTTLRTVTIAESAEDGGSHIVTVATADADATEPRDGATASDTGRFTLTLSDGLDANTQMQYALSGDAAPPGPNGTALAASDYALSVSAGDATILGSQSNRFITFHSSLGTCRTVDLTVTPVADTAFYEPREKVIFTLAPSPANNVIVIDPPTMQRTVTIEEVLTIAGVTASSSGEDGEIAVTVTLNKDLPAGQSSLLYTVVATGDGVESEDFSDAVNVGGESPTVVPINLPSPTDTLEFTVQINDDNRVESTESGTLVITGGSASDGMMFALPTDLLDATPGVQIQKTGVTDNCAGATKPQQTAARCDTVNADGFTITDNDGLRLFITDADVRESAPLLAYTVIAEAVPSPDTSTGVILDRPVNALLATADGSAMDGTHYTALNDLTGAITFSATGGNAAEDCFDQTVNIGILDADENTLKTFGMTLAENDATAALGSGMSIVTIQPDPSAGYDTTTTITVNQAKGTSDTSTFTLAYAPVNDATARFTLTGGTAAHPDITEPDVHLTGGGDIDTLVIGESGTAGYFTIAAADITEKSSPAATAALIFTGNKDDDIDDETLVFTVTGVAFADRDADDADITGTDIGALNDLTIRITDGDPPTDFEPLNVRGANSAGERNNVPAFTTLLISSAADPGPSVVSFTLGGVARFGTRAEDGAVTPATADYLLDVTDAAGEDVAVNYSVQPHTFSLPGGVNIGPKFVTSARFTVTPVADGINDDDETVLINATGVILADTDDIVTPSATASVTIADYGDTPTITIEIIGTIDNTFITEGSPSNGDRNTLNLDLTNAPDGIATIAYSLTVGGPSSSADDITATFRSGHMPVVNGDGTDTLNMSVTGGVASSQLRVIAVTDRDEDDETVTLEITGVTFADIGDGTDITRSVEGSFTIRDGVCGRTQQVHAAIAAAGVLCYGASDQQLAGITALNLASTNVTALRSDDFAGLTGLQTLNLNGNTNLRELPEGLFSELTNLQALYLNNAGLTDLRADVFNGLGFLHTLHLHNNPGLTSLPGGVFDDVLDTLGSGTTQDRGLQLDDQLKGTLSFAAAAGDLDQGGEANIEVRLNRPLPAAVRVLYTVRYGSSGTATHFRNFADEAVNFADGAVNIAAGVTSAIIDVRATLNAPLGTTATLTLSTPSLTFGEDGENNSPDVVPELAVVVTNAANTPDTHTLTIIQGICSRTDEVRQEIMNLAGESVCGDVTPAFLENISTLDLSGQGINTLRASDFAGLTGLQTLLLNGNSLTELPEHIFDSVLDTLTTLNLNGALRGIVSFTTIDGRIRQGHIVTITATRTLPYTAVDVPYTVAFGGSPAAGSTDFSGLQNGTLTFTVGDTEETITVIATDTAPPGGDVTITLETPTLPADTRIPPKAGIVDPVVRVDSSNNARTLRVVAGVLTSVAGAAAEKNNVPVVITLAISDIEDDGASTVFFELAGATFNTDYLLAITRLDGSNSGAGTDITADSGVTASGGVFTLPANVHEADFTITPIADSISDDNETVLVTATGVTFADGPAITIPATASITITDYGTLPTATLTVTSKDRRGTDVSEGNPTDDLGTFTLALTNAPTGIAIVTYTLNVTGNAVATTDITTAFGSGVTVGGTDRPVINAGSTFAMSITGIGTGSAALTAEANIDRDEDNETVTLAVTGVTFTDIGDGTDITGSNVQGVLTVNDGICGRTPQVHAAITAAAGEPCYGDITSLTGVTAVNLQGAGITGLRTNDFSRLTLLQTLNLRNNTGLTNLPDGVFNGLATLQALYLNNTGLTSLRDDVFNELHALQALHLHNNPPALDLPTGVFDGVLDTLGSGIRADRGLMLDSRFQGALSFNGAGRDLPQRGRDSIEVRLDMPLPSTVRVTYTATFENDGTSANFNGLDTGTVDIAGGVTSATITVITTSGAPPGATATLMLSAPLLIFDGGENTSADVVPELAVVSNAANIHTLTVIQKVCGRTQRVLDAIEMAAGVSDCQDVTAALLNGITELDLSGQTLLTPLEPGDFAGLNGLMTLDLSGTGLSGLPNGILDDVLDTLTTLTLDDALRGAVSFTATGSRIRQDTTAAITVTRTQPYTAVDVPYTTTFGGSADITHFADFQNTLAFAAGETEKTIVVTALGSAPPDSTVTVTLDTPTLTADTRPSPDTGIADSVVRVAEAPDNAHTLTVAAGIRTHITDSDDGSEGRTIGPGEEEHSGDAAERNNVPAVATLLVSDITFDGTATVSFTLGGVAKFGTLAEGVTDYLLAITRPDGSGGVTDITADSAITTSGGTFTLPPDVHTADFIVTPVADDDPGEGDETILITVTGVVFSDGPDITIPGETDRITIADYNPLPTAALTVSSEDGANDVVTEGNTGDDLGTFILELSNAPSGTNVATVAYTLTVAGASSTTTDIIAAFAAGANAGGAPVVNGDGADTFTMTVTDGIAATAALTVVSVTDRDEDDETVTLAVTGVTFTDIGEGTDIARKNVSDGVLTISDGVCGRTQKVQDTIAADGILCYEAIARLGDIIELNLASTSLTLLPGDFAGLTGLQILNLSDNPGLGELPDGVFNELTALQALYLNNTGLGELPDNVFNALDALQTLHLHDNPGLGLPAGVFDGVLDTLGSGTRDDPGLMLDARFRGTLSFTGLGRGLIQQGRDGIEVRLDKTLPTAVRAPYTVVFSSDGTTGNFGVDSGAVDIAAGATSATIAIAADMDAPIGATAVLTLSTPRLIFGGGDGDVNTSPDVVPQLAAVTATTASTHTLTIARNVCARTQKVRDAINEAAGVSDCRDVTAARLAGITALDLSTQTITLLEADDFAGLTGLRTLDLRNNSGLTDLPGGILDDVLNTLTTLTLDDALRGTVSFTATNNNRIRQDTTTAITVRRTLPYTAVDVPYTAGFSGGANNTHFPGLQSPSMLTFTVGETEKTITVAAGRSAPPNSTVTITLETPILPADTRDPPIADIVGPVVRVASDNAHALTVEAGILTSVTGTAAERNNVPAAATFLISDIEDDGVATVFFTLGGATFGTLAQDGTDYLLAITHSDGGGDVTDITAGSVITASGGTFTLPANVHEADFIVTPVADDDTAEGDETLLITATSVTFSAGSAITIPAAASIAIADYGDLPDIILSIASEDGGNVVVTEGNENDDFGTFVLTLANAPDGTDIATITYSLTVGGDTPSADDITAAFTSGHVPVINGDGTDILTLSVTGGTASSELRVIAVTDRDEDDETVTLEITGVTFADIGDGSDIAGENVSDGVLTINDGVCGRTQQVQAAIVAAGVLCYEASGQLSGIANLSLTSTDVTALRSDDFAGLTGLQTLSLSGNTILRELPEGLFSELTNLQALYLNNTGLTDLRADVFNGLNFLHTLHLHDNAGLTSLRGGIFDEILDTLGSGTTPDRGLQLDDQLKGTLSFAEATGDLDQGGEANIEVRLNRPLPAAVRVPYTVRFGPGGDAADFSDLADGMVDIAAGVTSATISVNARLEPPLGVIATLTLNTPSLTFGEDGENTSPDVVPELAVVATNAADMPDTHTLTIIQGICSRTDEVRQEIMDLAEESVCGDVTPAFLDSISTLDLSGQGIVNLRASDFAGLAGLQTLLLNGNPLTELPEHIFDSVLDTLTTLNLNDALRGIVSFTTIDGRIRQGHTVTIAVTRTLPYTAVDVPYTVQFGGSPAADSTDFSGLQNGTLTFTVGDSEETITVIATDTAPPGGDVTITLGTPTLPADTRIPPEAGIVDPVVRVDTSNNARTLTVVAGILTNVTGTAAEKNNVPATATFSISDIEDDGAATVSFELSGATFSADYLLAITHPADNGFTDITAGSVITASGGTFTLPANVHEADFIVTPVADRVMDTNETVQITATGVTFSDGPAITIPAAASIPITDYGNLPTATLTIISEDGDDAVTEGNEDDDLGTFTLELTNAPDGADIATVAYTLNITSDVNVSGDGNNIPATVLPGAPGTFTMTVTGGTATGDLTAIPDIDTDEDDETVTLTITGVTFADIGDGTDITGSVQGVLTVNDGICGRTQQVQDAIATVADMPCYGNIILADVTELDLASTGITALLASDFAGLTGLLSLNLSDNRTLTALTDGVFSALINLKTLNLNGTGLTGLTDGVFNGLTDLEALYLNNTGLTGPLPAGVFNALDALQTLHLHNNPGLGLPAGVFDGVLDTLGSGTRDDAGLLLDSRFRGTLAFTGRSRGLVQGGRDSVEVRLDRILPTAVRVPYTVAFSSDGMTSHFGVDDGMVDIAAGATNATIAIAADANAPVGATAVLTLSTPRLTFNGDESTRNNVVSQLAVVPTNAASTHTLTIAQSICGRTQAVHEAISSAAGESDCRDVTADLLARTTELNLSGQTLTLLESGDFAGLTSLLTLNLSDNPGLTGLPEGILDDVLDTLTSLNLDSTLTGSVSFTETNNNRIRQDTTTTITVMRTQPYTAVDVPYTVGFSGGANNTHFPGLENNTLTFAAGETEKTITVAADGSAPPDSTVTITLETPTLPADTRPSPDTGIAGEVVQVAPDNAHALTVEAGILTRVAGTAAERNNTVAVATFLISDIEDDGTATVFFTLGGATFGTLAQDGTDYLLAITHSGGTDITADSVITASTGRFTLPPDIHRADFTVTPVADGDTAEGDETLLITATTVTFAAGPAITIPAAAAIAISDYGDLPAAGLSVTSEDSDDVVTEGNEDDDLGTFTLELTNAPDGVDVATVAYTLNVTGASSATTDIIAAFDSGANADGDPLVNSDSTFTMTVTDGGAAATLTVVSVTDRDEDDETVTLVITGVTFADIGDGTDIAGENVQGDNDLTVSDSICGRTQKVQDAIIAVVTGESCYEEITLNSVTELNLASTGIMSLLAGDFAGLTELLTLDLSGNPTLIQLPDDVFSALSNLLTLDLSNTGLTGLTDGVFNGLIRLQTLNLSDNASLRELPGGVFSELAALQALYLNNTGLTGLLPAGVFNSLDALQTLHLHNNPPGLDLPAGVFDGVLDTLGSGERDDSGLMIDSRFRGTLSFTGRSRGLVQQGRDSVEVRLDKILPAAVRVPYTVAFGNLGNAANFNDLADGAVDIAAGVMSTTIAIAANMDAPIGATAVLTLSTPRLIFGDDDGDVNTSPDVVPQLAAVTATAASTHTLTIARGVCSRTQKVHETISVAAGVPDCQDVTAARLAGIPALDLSGQEITGLQANDFAGLTGLETLNLSNNPGLTALLEGILDDVLDTLTNLDLDSTLTGSVSFAATTADRIRQDTTATITVMRTQPYTAVDVPYTVGFGGSPAADSTHFPGLENNTLTFAAGETEKTITVAAGRSAPPDGTVTITLETPTLPADTRPSPDTGIVGPVVQVALANARTLTVEAGIITNVDFDTAAEKNNLTAFATFSISDIENDGIATVSFTLDGIADFGALAEDGADYLLAITHPDNGDVTDITADSNITASGGTFTLPANVHRADLTVTPVADRVMDIDETVLITPTGVTFTDGPDITIAGDTATITITDYGVLPTATLTVTSEGLNDAMIAEGNTGDDEGTFTLQLTNAPDAGIATVAYAFTIAGASTATTDITAAFGNGVTAGGGPLVSGDSTFTMTVGGDGTGTAELIVTAATDRDEDNEIVTLTINGVTFADIGDGTDIAGGTDDTLTINDGICGRTQQVREAIVTAAAATCHGNPDLAGVTELNLPSLDITTLLTGDFAGLTGLLTLDLSGNTGLTGLPEDVFSGLSNLQTLNLSGNTGLTGLLEGLFSGLDNLQTLNLSGNTGLTELPEGLFSGLGNLQTLNLSGNTGLTGLPEGLFSELGNLQTLNLSGNTGLTGLPEGLFSGLGNLLTLDLSGNTGLTELPEGLFNELPALQALYLNNTGLATELPVGVLNALDALQTLHLHNNSALPALLAGVFDGVLDTLGSGARDDAGLMLDPRFRGALSFTGTGRGLIQQGRDNIEVRLDKTLPTTVRVTYTIAFGNNGATEHFNDPANGMVDIPSGVTDATIAITASDDAPIGATALLTLSAPRLIFDGGENARNTVVPQLAVASTVANIHTLTITRNVCTRTQEVLDAIRTAAGVSDCRDVTAARLADITALDLSEQEITGLEANDFAGLTGLETLDLSINPGLTNLPEGILDGVLDTLITLDLGSSLTGSVFFTVTESRIRRGSTAAITVTRTLPYTAVDVPYTVTFGGSPTADSTHFPGLENSTLTFTVGKTEKTIIITAHEEAPPDGTATITLEIPVLPADTRDPPDTRIVGPVVQVAGAPGNAHTLTVIASVRVRIRVFLEGALQ